MSRRASRILDRGSEVLTLYPVMEQVDMLGNAQQVPNYAAPVTRRVNVSTDRQSYAELPGHVDVKVLKVSTRALPAETHSVVILRGEEWDVAVPPVESNISKTTTHISMILRSRNRKAGP